VSAPTFPGAIKALKGVQHQKLGGVISIPMDNVPAFLTRADKVTQQRVVQTSPAALKTVSKQVQL